MSAILTLSITCVTGRYLTAPYRFTIKTRDDATLADLQSCILDMVNFDGDHLADFYLANGPYGRQTFLTPDGEWDDDNDAIWKRRLADLFPLPKHKKLYYLYDMGASWRFEISKRGVPRAALPGGTYPLLVSEEGIKPLEYGADDEDEDEESEDGVG